MKFTTLLVLLLVPTLVVAYPLTPDSGQTPGELCSDDDSDFEEYRYSEQIAYCKRQVSAALKRRIYDSYGIPERERKDYTIDHLIPLSVGGDNKAPNLWPEHKEVKALRPELEMEVYVALRDGEMTQREAVRTILDAKFHPRGPRRPDSVMTRVDREPVWAQ